MSKNARAKLIFRDESAARTWLEGARWPNGPVCPKCSAAKAFAISKRSGLYRCSECRKDFTVTVGTVMEKSHIKLTQWAVAFHLAAFRKEGFSAHDLYREFGCQLNTAWFMFQRVREAMRRVGLECGPNQFVEADLNASKQSSPTHTTDREEPNV